MSAARLHGQAVNTSRESARRQIGELAVADQNAEAARVQIGFVLTRNAVDDAGQAKGIVGASPALAGDGHSRRNRPIDVGELVGLDVATRHAGAREHADIPGELLLGVEADAGAAPIVPHGVMSAG